ncbi:MAG: hypothetical protein JJE12_12155 [Anaerolineales bacterium]|nr:hypothetical protein [Anaerolineales bacterium]
MSLAILDWSTCLRDDYLDQRSILVLLARHHPIFCDSNHEYAQEKLVESGEAEEFELHHSQYFTSMAIEAEQELYGLRQEYWLTKLRVEYDNLRTAMERSLEGPDVVLGYQIIGALRYFWFSDGLIAEGFKWIERALVHGNFCLWFTCQRSGRYHTSWISHRD